MFRDKGPFSIHILFHIFKKFQILASISYPASATLICTANPCKCGYLLETDRECRCSPRQVQQYLGRLSGPLLDRIDIHIEVSSVKYGEIETARAGENSRTIRERVKKAREIQLERYKGLGIFSNSQLKPSMLERFCKLDRESRSLLKSAFEKLGLSARAHNRILKVARTIADMDDEDDIRPQHIAEAVQYRSLDRRFWQNGGIV